MEIDITDLFQALAETNLMLFSASRAEMGEDAGSHTWANCMNRAGWPLSTATSCRQAPKENDHANATP